MIKNIAKLMLSVIHMYSEYCTLLYDTVCYLFSFIMSCIPPLLLYCVCSREEYYCKFNNVGHGRDSTRKKKRYTSTLDQRSIEVRSTYSIRETSTRVQSYCVYRHYGGVLRLMYEYSTVSTVSKKVVSLSVIYFSPVKISLH